ncbi:hypothetical protein M426DRAFT_13783 [Hypoxylon sp. CI-4A]|nr:hypothetical protein M426DRAFT_13783 [Hypoxylon sp. CI-4A]
MAETQRPTIWGLGITFSIIAVVAVILRFKARRIKGQKLKSDDWTILAALVLSLGVTVDILIMAQHSGLGTHGQHGKNGNILDPEARAIFGKASYALEILAWPAVGITKISVLLMYKRIFTSPGFRLIAWALVGLSIALTITFTFALIFSCMPIVSRWDYSISYTCVDEVALVTTALATDVATDFFVLLLPIHKIWQLQMPLSRKISIVCIFLLGGLVSIVGIIRIHFLTQVYHALGDNEIDVSWIYVPVYYWTMIETNVGVLSACLPTLRPIQEHFIHNISLSKLRASASRLLLSSKSGVTPTVLRLRSVEEGMNYENNTATSHVSKQPKIAPDSERFDFEDGPIHPWA